MSILESLSEVCSSSTAYSSFPWIEKWQLGLVVSTNTSAWCTFLDLNGIYVHFCFVDHSFYLHLILSEPLCLPIPLLVWIEFIVVNFQNWLPLQGRTREHYYSIERQNFSLKAFVIQFNENDPHTNFRMYVRFKTSCKKSLLLKTAKVSVRTSTILRFMRW